MENFSMESIEWEKVGWAARHDEPTFRIAKYGSVVQMTFTKKSEEMLCGRENRINVVLGLSPDKKYIVFKIADGEEMGARTIRKNGKYRTSLTVPWIGAKLDIEGTVAYVGVLEAGNRDFFTARLHKTERKSRG